MVPLAPQGGPPAAGATPEALSALSLDAALEARLAPGRIIAAYRSACLLETDAGALITLALPALGNGPGAILLAAPGGFSAWPVGARYRLQHSQSLSFDHGPLIEWTSARRWSIAVSAPAATPPLSVDATGFAVALSRYPVQEGLLPVVLGAVPRSAAQTALARRAAAALALLPEPAAARLLIGLGPGSTPSGDDLLAGLLLTLHYGRHPAAEPLRAVAAGARTTRLGQALLAWAAAGAAAEHTLDLLRLLLSGPLADAIPALELLLARGATSGADTCAGILLGLRLLQQRYS